MVSLPPKGTCSACGKPYFGTFEAHRFQCEGPVPQKRARVASWRSVEGLTSNTDHDEADSKSQSLVQAVDPGEVDDYDWVSSVPGRPSPYPTTWNLVYGGRKPVAGGFEVACVEGGDGNIRLDSKLHEIAAASTPHGKPRKPPVCHDIPWVLLSVAMDEHAKDAGKALTDAFKRYVCWGDTSNLRTGHNGCNAGGTKVTAQTATASELGRAKNFVDRCLKGYSGLPYQT